MPRWDRTRANGQPRRRVVEAAWLARKQLCVRVIICSGHGDEQLGHSGQGLSLIEVITTSVKVPTVSLMPFLVMTHCANPGPLSSRKQPPLETS